MPHPGLVLIGGGETSLEVLGPVLAVARAFGASITLLHVSERVSNALSLVRTAEARLHASGVPVRTRFESGSPAQIIAALARRPEYDLLAMATHARGILPRLFLGSVTESVLRHVRMPMLIGRGLPAPVPAEEAP